MTGFEALEELKLGHKIRKTYWKKDLYIISYDGQTIYYNNGNKYQVYIGTFLENDWELYEELELVNNDILNSTNLVDSEKRMNMSCNSCTSGCDNACINSCMTSCSGGCITSCSGGCSNGCKGSSNY
jgi:hypothetical protein